jgi:hypothetical protein
MPPFSFFKRPADPLADLTAGSPPLETTQPTQPAPAPPPPPSRDVPIVAALGPGPIKWTGYGLSFAGLLVGFAIMAVGDGGASPDLRVTLSVLLLSGPLVTLALMLASPEIFESRTRRGRRSTNATILILPVVGMLIANLYRSQIDPFRPVVPGLVAAAAVLPLAWWARRRKPGLATPNMFMICVVACAAVYGYGATALADIQLDESAGAITPVEVTGKHEHHGRSTSYYVETEAWGPHKAGDSIEVPTSTYDAVEVGGKICIYVHPGTLGLPWFMTDVCPQT